jgi:hypothetical protein
VTNIIGHTKPRPVANRLTAVRSAEHHNRRAIEAFGSQLVALCCLKSIGATHFSAWTKRLIEWLDPSTVPLHLGRVADYTLHANSLIQPPPAPRVAAVQIGQQVPYLMVEGRLRADQFDMNISSEGVIVYQVQTSDATGQPQTEMPQLNLLTKTALMAGDSFTAANGVTVQVNGAVAFPAGGFSITVTDPNVLTQVPDVFEMDETVASTIISNAGLVPKFNMLKRHAGSHASILWVRSQSPAANALVPLGSTVTMELSDKQLL